MLDRSIVCYLRVLEAHGAWPSTRRGKLIRPCTCENNKPSLALRDFAVLLWPSEPPHFLFHSSALAAQGSVLSSPSLRAFSPSQPCAIFSKPRALVLRAGPALSSPSPVLSALVLRASYSWCTHEFYSAHTHGTRAFMHV